MANLRTLKKDIDYLVEEVLADCYLAIFFHPEKKDQILAIIQEAVDMRNDLFHRVNNPPEKLNTHLNRKHYGLVRREMLQKIDKLFSDLSSVSK